MMINYVQISKLIEFRNLSERRQTTFVNNLKSPKKPKADDEDSSGGNYWQRCLSGVSTSFKQNDNTVITERIESLLGAYEVCDKKLVKSMYERNLKILQQYEEFDFSAWHAPAKVNYISKTKIPLTIDEVPLRVVPQHVFSWGNKESPNLGGIFFVASVKGYKSNDLGIFSEAVFKHLSEQYSDKYYIDPYYCMTVDAATMEIVRYKEILDGKLPALLETTVEKLKKFL